MVSLQNEGAARTVEIVDGIVGLLRFVSVEHVLAISLDGAHEVGQPQKAVRPPCLAGVLLSACRAVRDGCSPINRTLSMIVRHHRGVDGMAGRTEEDVIIGVLLRRNVELEGLIPPGRVAVVVDDAVPLLHRTLARSRNDDILHRHRMRLAIRRVQKMDRKGVVRGTSISRPLLSRIVTLISTFLAVRFRS